MLTNKPLDHIGTAVTDAAAAAAWYQEVLGYHLKGKFPDNNGAPTYFVANQDESVVYEIYGADLPADAQGKIDHISYTSTDIEADYAEAVKKGYKITTDGIESIPTFWDHGIRYFKIESPTKEQIEFCQKL